MITTNEFSAYFSIMEEHSIKPEAMLMIIKYCVDLKGKNIGFRYISKVANDFALRGIVSESKIERFILEKQEFILRALENYSKMQKSLPNPKLYIDGETITQMANPKLKI